MLNVGLTAYLLFGQAMPSLAHSDDKWGIIDCLHADDNDLAIDFLIDYIDKHQVQVDPDLLSHARMISDQRHY